MLPLKQMARHRRVGRPKGSRTRRHSRRRSRRSRRRSRRSKRRSRRSRRKSKRSSRRRRRHRRRRSRRGRRFGAFGSGAPDSLLMMQGPYGGPDVGWGAGGVGVSMKRSG
jgi:hypothetical protein